MSDLPEHVRRNRTLWDDWARKFVAAGEEAWAQETSTWGIWSVPESQVGMFPKDLAGKDAIELGCGTAYLSATFLSTWADLTSRRHSKNSSAASGGP